MASNRRRPLLLVLALALGVTGVVTTEVHQTNPSALPNGLAVSANAESTALYCTGLGSASTPFVGHVTFLNTTNARRSIAIQLVSNTAARFDTSLVLPAHASRDIAPNGLLTGTSFGLGAQVDGGGVVAEEVTSNARAEVPCLSSGVTNWYASGFDTLVGSLGLVSIYNPTATAAVMNVTTYSTTGFAAPAPFQGFAVGAHSQVELNLGAQIVNASDIGVRIRVLRGSVVVVGVQQSHNVVSFSSGSTSLSNAAWFPRVTTAANALAQVRIANPSGQSANVTLDVSLPGFTVAPQIVTVPAYSSAKAIITPNPAIPAAGYATVQLSSNVPVIAALDTGSSAGLSLSSPETPAREYLLSDFSGKGFNAATLTDTSSRTISVTFTTVSSAGQPLTGTALLAGNTTTDIRTVFSTITTLRGVTLLINASKPTLILTTTLPSTPVGVTVVQPLNGG